MTVRDKIISGVSEIPTLPVVASRLTVMLRDREADIGELVDLVRYDPALTAGIIRLANSAVYGAEREISTLRDAVVRLGLEELHRYVTVTTLAPVLSRPVQSYQLGAGQLWRHSVAAALAAEAIEEALGEDERDGLSFTAALLHDVGKLVFDSLSDEYFSRIELEAERDLEPFDEAEKRILGIDHTEAGALVLEQWSFPEELVEVARWHHQPGSDSLNPRLIDIVHLADMTAMMMGVGLGRDALGYRASGDALGRVGLNRQGMDTVACRMIERLEEVEKKFAVEHD